MGVISTFNLALPSNLSTITNIIGSSVDFATYNLECYLADNYNGGIPFLYYRIIVSLLIPFLYLAIIIILYIVYNLKNKI